MKVVTTDRRFVARAQLAGRLTGWSRIWATRKNNAADNLLRAG
jgi:hypothetical protein